MSFVGSLKHSLGRLLKRTYRYMWGLSKVCRHPLMTHASVVTRRYARGQRFDQPLMGLASPPNPCRGHAKTRRSAAIITATVTSRRREGEASV